MKEVGLDTGLPRNARLGIDSTYNIRRIISQSELAIVYAARQDNNKQMCIVKEFFPRALARRNADRKSVAGRKTAAGSKYVGLLEAFLQEAELLNEAGHPNIAGYVDHFEENGTAYLVMEYCQGVTLDQYVKNHANCIDARFLRATFVPLIGALEHMHELGIIHRDIKPGNIMIDEGDQPKLLDFGSAVRYTETGHPIFTTAGYSPLELYSEKSQQTPASDIYSLAATLYYCCSGQPPYDVRNRLFEDKLAPVRSAARNVSPLLSRVIHWGMRVSADKRCPSLKWFKAALHAECYLARKPKGPSGIGPTSERKSLSAEREG